MQTIDITFIEKSVNRLLRELSKCFPGKIKKRCKRADHIRQPEIMQTDQRIRIIPLCLFFPLFCKHKRIIMPQEQKISVTRI